MAKLPHQNSKNTTNASSNLRVVKPKRTRKTIPRDSPPQRSSIYRGVTRHRWTGRYEAHLWDKNCWNEAQNKKGRQVYLGAYDDENAAAHAYDLAALKYWGAETILNFPLGTYKKELIQMEGQSREGYIGSLRRRSSGFSRGVSKYRGVARHHHNGRWEARIGRVFGNKYLYLGTYATQEEAAIAYDMAAIEYRGLNAVTNFDLSHYIKWLKPKNDTNIDKPNNTHPNVVLSFNPNSSSSSNLSLDTTDVTLPKPQPTPTTTALGLLLQSSKFKEMMEMSLAVECPYTPQELVYPSESSFPEDIKACLESNDFYYSSNDHEDGVFEELNFLMQPMVQFESMLYEDKLML